MGEKQPESSRRNPAEHLKPHQWKKGQSGNPGGRKKGESLNALIMRELDKPVRKGARKTKLQELAEAIVSDLLKREPVVFKALIDRLWPVINQHLIEGTFDLSGARDELAAKLESMERAEEKIDRELVQ